jgi:hypothetical protein
VAARRLMAARELRFWSTLYILGSAPEIPKGQLKNGLKIHGKMPYERTSRLLAGFAA